MNFLPPSQFTQWVEAVIFVFSLDDELSFSVLSGYYAKMAQYRKYISDIPVVLVAITGENDEHIIVVCFLFLYWRRTTVVFANLRGSGESYNLPINRFKYRTLVSTRTHHDIMVSAMTTNCVAQLLSQS